MRTFWENAVVNAETNARVSVEQTSHSSVFLGISVFFDEILRNLLGPILFYLVRIDCLVRRINLDILNLNYFGFNITRYIAFPFTTTFYIDEHYDCNFLS